MYDKCQALASFRWSHFIFKNHVSWYKLFHQIYLVCFFSSLCCTVSCMKQLLLRTFEMLFINAKNDVWRINHFLCFFMHSFALFVYFSWHLFRQLNSFYSWYWQCENTTFCRRFGFYTTTCTCIQLLDFDLNGCLLTLSLNCT